MPPSWTTRMSPRLKRQILSPMAEALLEQALVAPRRALRLRRGASRTARLRALSGRARCAHGPAAGRIALPLSGTTSTRNGRRRNSWRVRQPRRPLYADLPVGVHPQGFDPLWAPHVFVTGVHGGAPPDLFFEGGQDWSFPPLHPERMREDGYRHFREIVRRGVCARLLLARRSRDGLAAPVLDPRGIRRPPRGVRVVSRRTSSTRWSRSRRTGRAVSSWARTSGRSPPECANA